MSTFSQVMRFAAVMLLIYVVTSLVGGKSLDEIFGGTQQATIVTPAIAQSAFKPSSDTLVCKAPVLLDDIRQALNTSIQEAKKAAEENIAAQMCRMTTKLRTYTVVGDFEDKVVLSPDDDQARRYYAFSDVDLSKVVTALRAGP